MKHVATPSILICALLVISCSGQEQRSTKPDVKEASAKNARSQTTSEASNTTERLVIQGVFDVRPTGQPKQGLAIWVFKAGGTYRSYSWANSSTVSVDDGKYVLKEKSGANVYELNVGSYYGDGVMTIIPVSGEAKSPGFTFVSKTGSLTFTSGSKRSLEELLASVTGIIDFRFDAEKSKNWRTVDVGEQNILGRMPK